MTTGQSPDLPATEPLASGFDHGSRGAWLALAEKALNGADFEKRMVTRTADGIRIEPIYGLQDAPAERVAAVPGVPPFARGTARSLIRSGWDIRQFHSGSDASELNKAILEDLAGGATSITLHLGAPGTSGMPLGPGALATALEGVLLDVCPISLLAGEMAPSAADALIALWDQKGIAPPERRGHFNADPIGMLATTGRLSVTIDDALASAVGLIAKAAPTTDVTALLADGGTYHCAGATEAQELGAMLSTFVAYLRAAEGQGVDPETAIPKIAISLAVDADEFLGIAKLRAARHLLWRVADASGVGAAAGRVHVTAVSSWRMMSKRDPWTNIIRLTIACTAGALGGADAVTVLPFTFALGQPDAFARRVARNIQIVCQEESSLGRVIDPAGGSWYVERLTDELAKAAWAEFQKIELEGGIVAALKSGELQDRIAKSHAARAKAVATGRAQLTGVSAFPLLGDDDVKAEPWPTAAESSTQSAAETVTPLHHRRLAEPFEALRDRADEHAAKMGRPYAVFLASLGAVIDHNVRSTWIKNYLAAGGIAAEMSDGYPNAVAAAEAFRNSGLHAACICSSDAIYAEHAEATARALKAAGARIVLMAGRPGDQEAVLKAAGVDQFLFAGADAVETLATLQTRLA